MKFAIVGSGAVQELKGELARHRQEFADTAAFIDQILKGNLEASVSEVVQNGHLGQHLISLQKHLKQISIDEHERNWHNGGLAKFADILRNKQSLQLNALADDIISNIVKYVDVNQGAIFTYEDETPGDEHLQLLACYAYERKKHIDKRINLGEGLVGQCILEKEVTYLEKVPDNYISITSGLGEARPRAILITPMSINEKIFGAIELASFKPFPQYKIDFVKKLSENIASAIKTVRENERVSALLSASQLQGEELKAQEEEMRQSMEELQATQEEMQRKTNEIARASAEMMSIVNGINATMATIEFTPEGNVITANEIFLKTMKYRLEDIRGRHHRTFVPNEILNSEDYKTFWTRLAAGESFTGVFKRVASDQKIVWLNAIYNPILNANGTVVKVVKFASDITAQQELQTETQGILKGINATMATIEFTPQGEIINANDNFLKVMKYSLAEIKGKHHRIFVMDDVVNSDEYKAFWQKLAAGKSITGEFQRVRSDKKMVWLNAIYNPIFNSTGEVTKVVKFATDITLMKEKHTAIAYSQTA